MNHRRINAATQPLLELKANLVVPIMPVVTAVFSGEELTVRTTLEGSTDKRRIIPGSNRLG
jgi:hypothetical protein